MFKRDFHFEWECPGSWNELSAWQLRRIARLEVLKGNPKLYRLQAVLVLFRVQKSILRQFVFGQCFNNDYLLFADFLLEKDKYLTENPIAKYRGFTALNHWRHMPYMQWNMAEVFFSAYNESQKVEDLNKLVATLYTKAGKVYDDDQHNANYKRISKWPFDIKMAVYLWYYGSNQAMRAYAPKVFKSGKGGKAGGSYGNALVNLMLNMAKNDLTKQKEVAAAKMPLVLAQLEKDITDAERNK